MSVSACNGFKTSDPLCSGKYRLAWRKQWRTHFQTMAVTKEQWEQILISPQQFDLEDLEEVRVNAMERSKACAKKGFGRGTGRGEGVGNSGDEPRRRACSPMDWEDWNESRQLAEEVISGTSHFCTPVHMMASRFKTWVAKWHRDHTSQLKTLSRQSRK